MVRVATDAAHADERAVHDLQLLCTPLGSGAVSVASARAQHLAKLIRDAR